MPSLIPIVVVLFIIASLLRIDFFFSVVYILAGVYIVGRIWAEQAIRQLKAERTLVNRAFPGESIDVTLKVQNTGWLPVQWVEVHDSLPVEMIHPPFYRQAISLKGHEEQRFTYSLNATTRGYYDIGPLTWRTGDLLGLSPQLDQQQPGEYIIVYPRVVALEQLGLPTHSPLAQLPAPEPLFEDPSRITGLRDYQAGDSPRRLHWSASASAGRLLVKRYQPAIARETVICLDMAQQNYNMRHFVAAIELAVTTAASLANHIIRADHLATGLNIQFFDPLEQAPRAMQLPPRNNRAQLMSILEILARAQRYSTEVLPPDTLLSLADYVRQSSTTLSWGATLIVITGNHNAALMRELLQFRQQGFAVALVLIMPSAPTEAQTSVSSGKINIYEVWREADLEVL